MSRPLDEDGLVVWVSGGSGVAELLWLVSGPWMVPPRPAGVVSPFALHPTRVPGLRVLGRSRSVGPCLAPPQPVGHPAHPVPFLGASLSCHKGLCEDGPLQPGKSLAHGGRPTSRAAFAPAAPAPESPSLPSLGILCARMTLNSEPLTGNF